MKKLLYILFFFLPVVVSAQFNLVKDSPLDYAWKNVGSPTISDSTGYYINLVFSFTGEPYVAYEDQAYSDKISVLKFDGNNWIYAGSPGFSEGKASDVRLAFNPVNGMPYVAFEDLDDTLKSTVMKFDGSSWTTVGNRGFSAGNIEYISLAFSESGEPYVAYMDYKTTWDKATVMKYDGANWINVGPQGFTPAEADFTSLAFCPTDHLPYVAFFDVAHSDKASVMKFNGNSWEYLGNPGFSNSVSQYISLAFSSSGEAFVAFIDEVGWSFKATVMTFDGNNWNAVGNQDFSPEAPDFMTFAVSPSGTPYIAFCDHETSPAGKVSVMKFDGNNWVFVGNEGFSAIHSYSTSIAIDQSSNPWVAFGQVSPIDKISVMKYDSVYVGVNEYRSSRLSMYPNPVTDRITIEISGKANGGNLSILNIGGQQLITRQITEPNTTIDISNLLSGLYFVQLTGERTVEMGKFVKQ
jgi:hypothetical protein